MSTRLIQDLHAGISRRDWSAVETAANALRDESEKARRALAATDFGSLPDDYPTLRMVEDRMEQLSRRYASPETKMTGPQDISTAPKMTDVLVWWPIVQLDEDGEPTEQVVDGRWIISEDQGGYWIEPDVMNAIGDHLGDDFTYAAQPSHWMPLPAPLFVASEETA